MIPPDDYAAADGLITFTGEIGDLGVAASSVTVESAGPTINLGDQFGAAPEQRKRLLWLLVAGVVLVALFNRKQR